ncbi:MAG: Gfo/Idh/MocA family oxidoreductase [Lentisphaerae bacterium]|nr:Gfo/Idh/MocA family oxidoreductase [Lentisphaerota bacterium]
MTRIDHAPRVAVVGYGRWGRYCHCALLRSTPGLCLHGVVSGDPGKRQAIVAEQGCRAYTSLDEALRDDAVDVVVLATPNAAHADQAVAALQAGKHVVTEKVMCLDLAECDRMIAAAEQAGRLLTVFQNRRLDGDFLTVQRLIAEGALGDVRWIEVAWQGFGIWGGWRGQASMGGGKIYDLGPHLLDQILILFPEAVTSVYCRTHHDLAERDVESEGFIVIGFESGRTAVVDVSSLAAVQKPRFVVRGTAGTFVKHGLDPQEKAMMAGVIDRAQEPASQYGLLRSRDQARLVPTLPGRWRGWYENLRDALTCGAAPLVTLPQARRLMAVLSAARRSAASGQVVTEDL